MKRFTGFYLLLILVLFCSCATSKKNYNPAKKYAPSELQSDFNLLRTILEKKHPAIYWYTPKEKMDEYFDKYYAVIKDSMTEQQFAWLAVAPAIDKIHCGHTSVSMSKRYSKWVKGKLIPSFPLFLKVWNDSMAVIGNLNFQKDSILKRGTLITSINGVPNKLIIKYMFEFLVEDGYASNVNYHRLSTNFPYYHRNIFGLSKNYTVAYIDSTGNEQKINVPLYVPFKDSTKKDSTKKVVVVKKIKKPKAEKFTQYRSLKIDSTKAFATMILNNFSDGHLRRFFRRSFKKLRNENIKNLVIDLRVNGGGKVAMSTLLTKYISRQPFKIADTVSTHARGLGKYASFIKGTFFNSIQMFFSTRKNKDGNYHIRRLEKHVFTPKKNNYNGKVYVLTSGPTFSASSLFCNAIKGQAGITLVGEETGGGWYGNTGIMIPDIKLPHTGVRVRLPLFKLVQVNHGQAKGTGIIPDVPVPPSYDAMLKGYDKKMEVVKEIIKSSSTGLQQ
jgi:Peptidase family S41